MAIQSHLAELERRHQALEQEISEALTHPATDGLKVAELKRRKLHVKDEIARLQARRERTLIDKTGLFPAPPRPSGEALKIFSPQRSPISISAWRGMSRDTYASFAISRSLNF